MSSIEQVPKNVLRIDVPPQAKDETAFTELCLFVSNAVFQLSRLGQNPIAIAASPLRFNDAWDIEGWLAIRCGTFFGENDDFSPDGFIDHITAASPEVNAAYSVLLELEKAGWRDLFGKAFGFRLATQSLSIVVQDGTAWLVFSSNNGSEVGDPVFVIDGCGRLTYFGEAEERFDWAIQDPVPLKFRVDPKFADGD